MFLNADRENRKVGLTCSIVILLGLFTAVQASAQKIAYSSSTGDDSEVFVANANGTNPLNLTDDERSNSNPDWSPDGSQIAYHSTLDGTTEVFVINSDGSMKTMLTDTEFSSGLPRWSPDGQQILFRSNRDGDFDLYVMNADGSGQTNLTNTSPANEGFHQWSPDGSRIAYVSNPDGNNDIFVMNADGSGQTNLTNNPANDTGPLWHPEALEIYFQTNRDGNWEIYAVDADGGGGLENSTNNPAADIRLSINPEGTAGVFQSDRDGNFDIFWTNGDTPPVNLTNEPGKDLWPRWSADGAHIIFETNRDGNWEIYAVDADGGNPTNVSNNADLDSSAAPFGTLDLTQPPIISEDGVVLATLLPTVSTVSPLSIISVFGQNLSTGTILFPTLDGNGDLDRILGTTCLEMNGERLPIFAITPGQINAQASAAQVLGPATFQVITECDTPAALRSETQLLARGLSVTPKALDSTVEMTTVEATTPGFFLFPPLTADGIIAARFNATQDQPPVPVAAADRFPDDSFGPSRPAAPGDIIVLYGTGWGETTAGLNAGELAPGAATLLPGANPTVSFGGVVMDPADVLYVGVTPNTAGLYQLVIRVPEGAQAGNNEVVLTVYGVSTPTGPVVPVAVP
jgi:uncharacterized protein (TIGR03437 family)